MKHKNKIIFVCLAASFLILLSGTFAFFTDYTTGSLKAKAGGNINIRILDKEITNLPLAPGDGLTYTDKSISTVTHNFNFSVKNESTFAVKTQHVILVSCENNGTKLNPDVFKIWKGNNELTTKSYLDANGKATTNSNNIKYVRYTYLSDDLNVGAAKSRYNYTFSMDKSADETYAGAAVNVDIIVNAIQQDAEDTNWDAVASESIKIIVGGGT